MGYYRGTKVKCTKPELLYTDSMFNKEWKEFIVNVKDGITEYYCRKEYLNDAIIELSKQHPNETFTGVTWTDDDYENAIEFTSIIKNGEEDVIKMAPHYQIFFPVIEDKEYNRLAIKFDEQIYRYLNRIDLVNGAKNEPSDFDILNDKVDEEGFKSYFTITWGNDIHKFTAIKRFTSQVIVDYHRKDTKNNQCEPDFECLQDYEVGLENILLAKEDWAFEEHLVLCANKNGDLYYDYDENIEEINDIYYCEAFDLGDVECLSEDDLFMNTWLVSGMEFKDFIDYLWEAEITKLCQNNGGDFYSEYRNSFSEHKDDQFSKYRCLGDSGFLFCNKESCEGCKRVHSGKVINPQYILWEKYVEPLADFISND